MMNQDVNVKIPQTLFYQTIDLLECIDIPPDDPILANCRHFVLSAYLRKKQKLDLRKSYENMIFAKDEGSRHNARMIYLSEKRDISDE